MEDDGFGCVRCWPESPQAAWEARGHLGREAVLLDDFHFRVSILRCAACEQRFVSVFTERIDMDGEDPQNWILLPITGDEMAALALAGEPRMESELGQLGCRRRSLHCDFPKGAPPSFVWSSGASVPMHD